MQVQENAMTTAQMTPPAGQKSSSSVSVLGILFFLLGAPHVYGALKRRAEQPKRFSPATYAVAVLLTGAIATAVEFSIL
jgi:hypothetical protein